MNEDEEVLLGSDLIDLKEDDVKKAPKIIISCLRAGAHISIWHLIESDSFRCEIWDEERSMKFRVDAKGWAEALAAVTKGFYENLQEGEQ